MKGIARVVPTNEVLEDCFNHKNQEYLLRLDDSSVSWLPTRNTTKSDSKLPFSIDLEDLLTTQSTSNDHYFLHDEHHVKKKSKNTNSSSVLDVSNVRPCNSFEIHYVVCRESKCKIERATFCHSDVDVVTKWIYSITQRVESVTNRPKNLLVFLNPFSGRKRGVEIYKKFVEPLFRLTDIHVNLVTTERANHAYDYLVENGWGDADGIVSVGGDGTFSETINGIVTRSANHQNVNLNDPHVKLPFPHIRVGIIPAGSTDTIAYSLHGTSDIQTAVIQIVAGDFTKTDLCSVHSESDYLSCFISLMSYGYLGDVIKSSISLRWLGPIRYDCAGARQFILHRSYEGTVSFLNDTSDEENTSVCSKNDCVCTQKTNKVDLDTLKDEKKWKLIRGKFFMVTAANISCSCSRSPNGIAPHCHFSDGYLNLLLIRRVTFCKKIKLLFTVSNKRGLVNNLDFVEIYKTRRFKFETGYGSGIIPATKISSWNIDGELIRTPHLYVQCHRQLINMFCRRKTVS